MNKILIALCSASMLLAGCSSTTQETIKINGELEETIEVHSEYVDKGVTYPKDKYELIVNGGVINTILGRYEIKYSIYTKEGELKKELHRFVNVVDTTAPSYELVTGKSYYVGMEYVASDFFTCADNYYGNSELAISPQKVFFTRNEAKRIAFSITDKSNNGASVNIDVVPTFDFYKLAQSVSYNVTRNSADVVGTYTTIRIGNDIGQSKSLTYYEDSGSLHYLEQFPSSLGTYASIQISAKFGEFSTANVSYHVSDAGTYSAGFANIDATKATANISQFRSTINNLNLDTSKMLSDCNNHINDVLSNFHTYMENTMHLDIY